MAFLDGKYEDVRKSIDENVRTIGQLIQQTNELKATVQNLEESDIKRKLLEQVTQLTETINRLIVDTTELFNNLADLGPHSTISQ
jgi:predicted nuclease with TOPRIM domain